MSKSLLTTTFNYSIPSEQLQQIMPVIAPQFANIPGCCWKLWLINEERLEAGGAYLFESQKELNNFLDSSLFSSIVNNPAFSNLQTSKFDVAEAASMITAGY